METKQTYDNWQTALEAIRKGHARLQRKVHSFAAMYIIYHEASDMLYVGSTNNLYVRIAWHRNKLIAGKYPTKTFQELYDRHENKNLRVSFYKVKDREEAYKEEQKLLDLFKDSGKLINVFTNAKVNGHGRQVSEESKLRQSKIGKRVADSGKIKAAWEARKIPVSIDGTIYPSMIDAAKALGISYGALRSRFRDRKHPGSSYRTRYFFVDILP
jgi:predicted GIY-YIG superfamily endonuclease